MGIISSVACLLIGAIVTEAATPPEFLWARRAGGTGSEETRAAAVDTSGNIFVTGFFSGTNVIDTTNFVSAGLEDIFLAKYGPAGNFVWARRAGGIGYDEGLGVTTDPSGNIYVAGLFQNTASFGTTNLTSSGQSDVFIAKYDPAGALLWARKAGSADFDEAHAIAVDAQGDVCIAGFFDANATFGNLALTNTSGLDDIFIAKCNSAGNFLWARKAGSAATNDAANSIALDASRNVYVTGYFGATATFGNTNVTAAGTSASPDAFLAKYDALGNFLWVRQAGGSGDDAGNAVAVDVGGNAAVAGRFSTTAVFSSTNLTGNGRDIFVARYNPAGTLLWARRAGGNNVIYGDAALGAAVDASSNVFVTGFFSGNASFGTTNVTGIAFNDVFSSKYDPAGNLLWVRAAGGSDLDLSYGMACDTSGNVFLAGFFASATAAFGDLTLTNRGERDSFLVKLGLPIIPALAITRSSGQLVLSWPAAASDFVLESATNLSAATIWTPFPAGSNTLGTNRVLALTPSAPRQFFRLRKQ